MDNRNIIERWVVLLLAEVLNLSATVAETILRQKPRWVARLRLLEANLRAPSQAPDSGPPGDPKPESERPSADTMRQVLESYAILSSTLKGIEARGLVLDDALVNRMSNDWSPKSIVSYLKTCDAQLKHEVGVALSAAAKVIAPTPSLIVALDNTKRKGLAAPKAAKRKPVIANLPRVDAKPQKDMIS